MNLLIKKARLIDGNSDFFGDIYIEKGHIKEIGLNLVKECDTIDVMGRVVMPAFTDLHCHFRDPGLTHKEDIETGSKAAVKGGYTTVNLMGNTKPISSNMDVVNYVKDKGREVGLVDINQVITITKNLDGKTLDHLDSVDSSVKFLTDDGKGVDDNEVMLKAMKKAKEMGLGIMSHAEDRAVLSECTRLAENLMTVRDIYLSKHTGCHLHLAHVSTIEAIEEIVRAKDVNANVTCEVTPHHIDLTSEVSYRVNPPLREEEDRLAIIEAIKKGYVDAIGTDHAPHTKEDKEKGAPGISGIETSFSVCYTRLVKEGHITLNKLSEIMSKNPSKILGVNKGLLTPGYEGDLVVLDLDKLITIDTENFYSKGKNTPIDGKQYYGDVAMTIKAGTIVYERK